jgi:polyisoprenyl-teichoic acid--peptidoglycan teichoic acid transferase
MSTACNGALIGQHDDPEYSADKIRLRRSLTLALFTVLVPGSAQLAHGNRRLGLFAMRVWATLLVAGAGIAVLALISQGFLFWLATNSFLLNVVRWLLVAVAIGWFLLIVDAWLLGKPRMMRRSHFATTTLAHGAIAVVAAGSLLMVAHVVAVMNGFTGAVFAATTQSPPHDGRYNILLLGADSGSGREGMRPDSINVVSIDAVTGRAVLIGVPRNLENVPFPKGTVMHDQFPKGFNCDGCMINAVNTWAEDHATLFGTQQHPGIGATMDAVEGVTGLKLNYYVLVNMGGFSQLVDALGGVKLTVSEPIAKFGHAEQYKWAHDPSHFIQPGTRVLSGDDVLWFARSRVQSDDWSRMARQKCVMAAMLSQVSPKKVLTNVQDVANSGENMLETDIPRGDLSTFMSLAMKTRALPVSSVSLVPPTVSSSSPNYSTVRKLIGRSIDASRAADDTPSEAKTTHTPTSTPSQSTPSTSTSQGADTAPAGLDQQQIKQANTSANLTASC